MFYSTSHHLPVESELVGVLGGGDTESGALLRTACAGGMGPCKVLSPFGRALAGLTRPQRNGKLKIFLKTRTTRETG